MKKSRFIFSLYVILSNSSIYSQTMTVKQYIDSFKNTAMIEMIEHKIPASITLAQGILESGSGNSRLAKQGNNHFGIKCKKEWTGCTILEDDDALQECFRCYNNPKESYKDHSIFLRNNKRYSSLFTMPISDYKGWANGLLNAGYATNMKYADLLIGSIERNKLAQYDSLVLNGYNPYNHQMPANIDIVENKVPYTVVQPNQSIEKIAVELNKTEKKIIKYNDLKNHTIIPGDVIYLKPKKRKAAVENHTVVLGDNMWLISQKYAIKLNVLYKKNKMEIGTEPKPGSVLELQGKAETTPDTLQIIEIKKENPKPLKVDSSIPSIQNEIQVHEVVTGETLYSISKKYGVEVTEIIKLNQLNGSQLNVGQNIKIPSKIGNQNTEILKQEEKIIKHTVIVGETLYNLSKKYNVKIEDIKKWNNLNNESLNVGQILILKVH
jgi:LysM repeat protein